MHAFMYAQTQLTRSRRRRKAKFASAKSLAMTAYDMGACEMLAMRACVIEERGGIEDVYVRTRVRVCVWKRGKAVRT